MRFKGDTIFITGGAGFIGSAVIRHLLAKTEAIVVNIDKLTYASTLNSIPQSLGSGHYQLVQLDLCDANGLRCLFNRYSPRYIMNLAAESHVDRSIDGPSEFIQTNIVGTFTLLQEALRYWRTLDRPAQHAFRLHHVSTDEVFGSLGETGFFTEATPYAPNSPYSATKASSDHLVRAWRETYGLPTLLTNCSNNYGPYQFPEKLIPHTIIRGLADQFIPVYGSGKNIRDWLFVEDHARALVTVLERGRVGETYNVGAKQEVANVDMVRMICERLDELSPSRMGARGNLITFVDDRPGHDQRYAIDPSKIENELGWSSTETLDSGLAKTVRWYLENRAWWESILDKGYTAERIGLEGRSIPLGQPRIA
jgi:dTDP-glucose 4,6-dehydratase